jgi:hypothetical protein
MTIPQNRCLFYGHDSELAYHMLLHSWANTMDAIDDDDDVNADIAGPTMVSARIFEAPAPPDVQFPFRQVSLPAAEMPPPGVAPAPGHPRAVNIIGIEAQPVLIETMVGTWYVDTPHDATNPGDDEFQPPPGPHNITINGDINPANADFLGQVIAFQLTNPFDRDIILTQGDGKLLYYIEFAGNFYQLAREDDSGGGSRIAFEEVRLHANETKVFYATSPQSLTNIEPRFVNAGSSPSHPAVVPLNPGFIEKFADAQFRNTPGAAESRHPGRCQWIHRRAAEGRQPVARRPRRHRPRRRAQLSRQRCAG